MNKKLQVFVSSTYTDLKEERQAAVEAILDAGHIPAGMELFKAGKSQMKTIQKWIDDSDVYMLILGGRYGSIEKESGLSYTELEYQYALSKSMPVFVIVLDDKFLYTKAASNSKSSVFENNEPQKYINFKQNIMQNKIVKFASNLDTITSIINSQLNDILNNSEYHLYGYISDTTKTFHNVEEVDHYINERIFNAQRCIYDLTWKDYYHNPSGRPNYTTYIQSQNDFLKNTITRLSANEIFYKEIFTFPSDKVERINKMQELCKYNNYWCGYFESGQIVNEFPKLHITIIDDEEAIFQNYDYTNYLCSICDKNLLGILKVYFDECWALCKKIKDNKGIHQETYNKIQNNINKILPT